MRTALGTSCGILYRGADDLEQLLEEAPEQLLDWQYSMACEGAMQMLDSVRVHLPNADLGLVVHGTTKCPPPEPSSVEVGAEAEYVAGACKLEKILKQCSGHGEGR